ncbi:MULTISPECIES: hypothetical protein [Mycolicibacterium]|uniref:hypothetical protein n=1 Tax=Mycolicibacterium TaxID=1866885 RepID=UPI0007EBE07E|nr:hypothetical protein [Mycolicibacterium fortuitum]OBG24082.1 hypothetical protein A5768_22175 [Mycolicibacterium fortuitum]
MSPKNRIVLSAITAAVLPIAACGGGAAQPTKTTAAEESSSATTAVDTPTAAAALPESCTATPAGPFGLTGVEVTPVAGHPDGAKTVRWTTNSPFPTTGTVAFTLVSGTIMRGVKFNDGELIGNYVFHATGAPQDNLTIPPSFDGNTVSAFIPAAAAPELGDTWSADVEVDAESTGKCAP